ncbi:DUF222 domain-containing protein [Parenemella sanctibonifatiensis]|uniref:DUF222 domain-containing protein n=1 Tax=Parenemella sanctibonifatiensis TaxID=2016505 RepID=A0A255EB69_9ACTN|nr:DUF222 domain-containing protein [Parenemella sanctibonifatiensis]OYN88776.1 hypothetical protein CGZ92_03455 [Parenemella sanctibonifatiensis]
MTDPHTTAALDVISKIRAAKATKLEAEAREFMQAAEFADLYDKDWHAIEYPNGVVSFGERLLRLGGEGTPLVAEFCVLELGAALGMPEEEAHSLVADALALRGRFPKTWAVLGEGRLRVWQVRHVVGKTSDLPVELCARIDAQVAGFGASMGKRALENMIDAIVLKHSPEAAQTAHDAELARRHVYIDRLGEGVTREIHARVDVPTAIHLDAQLNRIATIVGQAQLRKAGNEASDTMDPRDVRRALALGILATPARALHLLQESLIDTLDDTELAATDVDAPRSEVGQEPSLGIGCPMASSPAHTCGQVTVDPIKLLPRAQLIVHVTDASLKDGGIARVEGVGPVLTTWLTELLADSHVTVRPVLAPDQKWATEAYEIPEAMREWIALRNPTSVFPFSTRNSRNLDIDHTIPWAPPRPAAVPEDGPPGDGSPDGGSPHEDPLDVLPDRDPPDGDLPLTRPGNLGPLTRRPHRARTHARWRVAQPCPGIFIWSSPLNFVYLVTPSHTWQIHDPTESFTVPAAA